MRAILIAVAILGLFLFGISVSEALAARRFQSKLLLVKDSVDKLVKLSGPKDSIYTGVDPRTVFEPLSGVEGGERAWLLSTGVSLAIFVFAAAGIDRQRRARLATLND